MSNYKKEETYIRFYFAPYCMAHLLLALETSNIRDYTITLCDDNLLSPFAKRNAPFNPEEIYDILNQEICTPSDSINKFNESDFWIILGDLNFRMSDLLYKQIINLIHERDFNGL